MRLVGTLLCLVALAGCDDEEKASTEGDPPAGGCDVVPPSACPSPEPTFADVQPIFTQQCGVCHGKDWTGAWPLDTYAHVADWSDLIRDELVTCSMPPADGGVTISLADRTKILEWIRCGTPK